MSLILKNSLLRLGYPNLLRVLPTRYKRFNANLSFKRNISDFNMSRLSNGMRVATMKFGIDSIPNSLTFGLWVDSGSRDEKPGKNGIAHFLEHLIFKGTYNRSRKEIESEIEDMGAHLNAYTTREQTVYQIRCFNQDLPRCMNLLGDIINNSKFCKSAIEQEKEVVLREMEEVSKSEEELIFDDLHREIYKNHPLGNTILGPKENILKFKREDLLNYIRTNYNPEKMMILGVGNIDHSSFKNIAETYFGNISNNNRNSINQKSVNTETSSYYQDLNNNQSVKKPILVHRKTNIDGKTLLAMAYNGVSWKSKDLFKIMFLQSMLGEYGTNNINRVTGYKNQILERILSGIKDHVEFFETFNTCYKDTGLFGWYLKSNNDLSHKEILENAKLISSRFKNLHSLITEDDIIRVKRILSYQLASLYENSGTLFEEIGRDLIVNNHYTSIDDKLEQIQKIDLEGIREIIHKYFHFDLLG
ncbi:mitochondrial processing peptidase beta subunit [Cryptosporidium ubiquitum]|uniref:Mitochondrial processing peptidase beta subunit n=1 Tax=Cryptosporidium ubiquitum TaxID=857276 RepID=A0A1J4MMV3_9CRYT|nr:mitochondrial processing peptidase beta subunit [Cryptosporidium ubiquitum]OII75586.1 mitochondrial processing peptidase beta subunit [Cryptosporidium ubiquitum]